MGADVKNLKLTGDRQKLSLVLEYANGNIAQASYTPALPFTVVASDGKSTRLYPEMHHMFENLIAAMMNFFAEGRSIIPQEETVCIASLLEESIALLQKTK